MTYRNPFVVSNACPQRHGPQPRLFRFPRNRKWGRVRCRAVLGQWPRALPASTPSLPLSRLGFLYCLSPFSLCPCIVFRPLRLALFPFAMLSWGRVPVVVAVARLRGGVSFRFGLSFVSFVSLSLRLKVTTSSALLQPCEDDSFESWPQRPNV